MGKNGGGVYGKIGNTVLFGMGSNKRWGDKFVGHCIKLWIMWCCHWSFAKEPETRISGLTFKGGLGIHICLINFHIFYSFVLKW